MNWSGFWWRALVAGLLMLPPGGGMAMSLQVEHPEAAGQPELVTRLVWTCPEHRDVTEQAEGPCPFGDQALVPTLVHEVYTCPIHAVIKQEAPGSCPICQRDLFLITEEVTYACPMHPEVTDLEKSACPICNMWLVPSTSTRPHQDHNPKHGGMFFMAPDNWHHLEGVYPEPGVFRVYLYNNFSEPMNAKQFKGRAVLKEVFDRTTRKTRELVAYPLLAAPGGEYLEAHVGSADLPRDITAKIQFERGDAFERFDFIFATLSIDSEIDVTDALDLSPTTPIPERAEEIAAAIASRDQQVRKLVTEGEFVRLYVPAMEARDLALALEQHVSEVPVARQGNLRWALREVVRSAWLLDDYGDLGNREKVFYAYDLFSRAVEEISLSFPEGP